MHFPCHHQLTPKTHNLQECPKVSACLSSTTSSSSSITISLWADDLGTTLSLEFAFGPTDTVSIPVFLGVGTYLSPFTPRVSRDPLRRLNSGLEEACSFTIHCILLVGGSATVEDSGGFRCLTWTHGPRVSPSLRQPLPQDPLCLELGGSSPQRGAQDTCPLSCLCSRGKGAYSPWPCYRQSSVLLSSLSFPPRKSNGTVKWLSVSSAGWPTCARAECLQDMKGSCPLVREQGSAGASSVPLQRGIPFH